MNRPYPPEPATHYDGADDHGYKMHDVLDEPDLEFLTDDIARDNIIYVRGVAHLLTWYGKPDEHGKRAATLEVWRPF